MSHTTIRFISSSSTSYKSFAGVQSKFLSKLINKNEPKRKWYKDNPSTSLSNGLDIQKKQLTSPHVQRRLTVLNKLFMKYITDLMSTSNISPKILEHQIEVTQVTLSPDYKIANVYWTHENINNKNWVTTTEEILKNYAFTLRHELSQLRIISHVPPINFVKDKTYFLSKEIEKRLAIADFGDDYKYPSLTLKQNTEINPSYEIDNKTSKSDVNDVNDGISKTNDINVVVPQMRHDVLGLDHHSIMSKIKISLNQSMHKNKNNVTYPTSINNDMNILTDKTQQELFTKFLKMRKIREKQKHRLKNPKEMKQNLMSTDVTIFDDDDDLETSFDDTFENEVNYYDWNIEKN